MVLPLSLININYFSSVITEVWEGYWNGVHVAIKRLKSMVDDELFQARFLREVESLRCVRVFVLGHSVVSNNFIRKGNHQNVVMFLGVCLRPFCIITEVLAFFKCSIILISRSLWQAEIYMIYYTKME